MTLIVIILGLTITPLETHNMFKFILGAVFIILGLTVFLFGVDIGITPIGSHMGKALAKSNKFWIVSIMTLLLGFIISIAEPILQVFAGQVEDVTSGAISKTSLLIVVAIGVGLMLTIGLLRILFNIPLKRVLTITYLIILALGLFTSSEFLAVSFDAAAAITGPLTVPFMLALALGVSSLKKDAKDSENDSFGLVGLAATGAIISVKIMSIISGSDEITGSLAREGSVSDSVFAPFLREIPKVAIETAMTLLPIVIMFLFFHFVALKLRKRSLKKIFMGVLYTFIGLTLFLTGVYAGFMEAGEILGYRVASLGKPWLTMLIGFILGLVVILAEPTVHVLTNQIEDVTSGYIKRRIVLIALSIGVSSAVLLSIIRIIYPGLQLWHYLLPGYAIGLILAHITPALFVGIGFDSGCVSSGPMSATFILAFVQGVAEFVPYADVVVDGFGVIAMVTLMPMIALQLLGLIFRIKSRKEV
ncbi:MAG: DUF1538 domain-containing protein [Clostridiaceae bacterium]|nr:DUF1538 domain-containing protein [Clostridiaceae bacterium]